VRDAAATVQRQLEALAEQDFDRPWEVVVVDNGSTDETVHLVGAMADRVPALHIVDASARVGLAHARNAGGGAARGSALVFCDADDEVAPGWLGAMVHALESADVVGGALDRTRVSPPRGLTPEREYMPGLQPWPGFLSFPAGANCGMRAPVFQRLGGFDESYVGGAEDTHFFWLAQLAGYTAAAAPDAVVYYRERHRLRDLARQHYRYGKQHPHLFRDFRSDGMTPSRWQQGLRGWLHLVLRAPWYLRSRATRREWVKLVARRAGRVVGSVRWRVLYL
jgi:GT2 family glycosyltransferase